MSSRTIVITLVLAFASLGLGYAVGSTRYDAGVVDGVASVTPPPTPSPLPVPTPQIVEVPGPTVEVLPAVCQDALFKADDVIAEHAEVMIDILDAYLDYPDENIADFGRRVETILNDELLNQSTAWEEYSALADSCLATP